MKSGRWGSVSQFGVHAFQRSEGIVCPGDRPADHQVARTPFHGIISLMNVSVPAGIRITPECINAGGDIVAAGRER